MTADAPSIRTMALRDHAEVLRPVQATPGGSVRDADAYAGRARHLARNPGWSFVAEGVMRRRGDGPVSAFPRRRKAPRLRARAACWPAASR